MALLKHFSSLNSKTGNNKLVPELADGNSGIRIVMKIINCVTKLIGDSKELLW